MPAGAPIPAALLSVVAFAAVFAFMFELGATFELSAYAAAWRRPALLAKSLFCTLLAVPLVAVMVVRLMGLPRAAQIGIVVMAIAPGAPVALRRALGAGGDGGFAVALQVTIAALSIVTVPLSVALLDEVFSGNASVSPFELAANVLLGQGIAFTLGALARRFMPDRVQRHERLLHAITGALLALLLVLALIAVWRPVSQAGLRVAAAIAIIVACALALGHAMGGAADATRAALAVASGARNAALAMLVAAANHASDDVKAAILSYLVVSAAVVTPYVAWRKAVAKAARPVD